MFKGNCHSVENTNFSHLSQRNREFSCPDVNGVVTRALFKKMFWNVNGERGNYGGEATMQHGAAML